MEFKNLKFQFGTSNWSAVLTNYQVSQQELALSLIIDIMSEMT